MHISQHAAALPYVEVVAKTANDMALAGNAAWKALQVAAVAIPLVTATTVGAQAVYERMTAASRKATAFKNMMRENPHLNAESRDPVLVQRYFNTLHNLNPQLASDPTVAASFVNNMVMTGTNPSTPHRDVYAQALAMQQRGGAGGRGGNPGLEAATGISEALLGTHKILNDEKMERMKFDLSKAKSDAESAQRRNVTLKNYATRYINTGERPGSRRPRP